LNIAFFKHWIAQDYEDLSVSCSILQKQKIQEKNEVQVLSKDFQVF